jgi:hypothetical protein
MQEVEESFRPKPVGNQLVDEWQAKVSVGCACLMHMPGLMFTASSVSGILIVKVNPFVWQPCAVTACICIWSVSWILTLVHSFLIQHTNPDRVAEAMTRSAVQPTQPQGQEPSTAPSVSREVSVL